MKLLATGKSGTIGRHLSNNVLGANFRNIESIEDQLKELPGSVLVHLAGVVGPSRVSADEETSFRVNVSDTLSLARKVIANGAKRFVFVSTGHIYGPSSSPCVETQEPNPTSIYAEQKVRAELELGELFAEQPCELLIVRLFSILGLDTPDFTLGGRVALSLKNGVPFSVPTSDDVRDFLSPAGAAFALEKLSTHPGAVGTINLGSGTEESVGDAVARLISTSGITPVPFAREPGNSQMPYLVPSLDKLSLLGFTLPVLGA